MSMRIAALRRALVACAAVATLVLAGCGGGGDAGAGFDVGIAIGGVAQPAPVLAGNSITVAAPVGQTIALDASEPVQWSFAVNGSPLFLDRTTVTIGGLTVTQVQVSPTRVVLISSLDGPAVLPVEITLVAASTFDAALVATVDLELQ